MSCVLRNNQPPLRAPRPPRAVVGSQISQDEVIFGSALDRGVVRRFFSYVKPYRKRLYIAIAAVLVFTGAQLSIPLIIRYAIDGALIAEGGNAALLGWAMAAFGVIIVINYGTNHLTYHEVDIIK